MTRDEDKRALGHLRAGPHERSEKRRGYRNGYRSRQLWTRVGTLTPAVPMDREGAFRAELFERYQRSEKAVVSTLMEMYLGGVSTRKVKDVTEALCGTSFSRSTVSRLTAQLDEDLAAWRERRLDVVAYPHLIVDARYEHVRIDGRVTTQGVLVVKGVREVGQRELLSVDVADSESEAAYDELFRRLKDRGLTGVRLVTSDDHRCLVNAIERHFQVACWRRCQVHFQRNALGKVGRKHQWALSTDLKAVFAAPTREWALDAAGGVVERFNQELKRRTRVVRMFPNREACLRLVTSICVEQSEEWLSGRRYLDMEHLEAITPEPMPEDAEVSMAA